MAIPPGSIWEVRTTGNDANGGFFVPGSGGTDYSQQDSAQLSVSDVVTNGTTTATSVTGGFTAAMVGNGINIAGTIYEVAARTDTNTITLDRTASSASGQTGKVGGAVATIGKAMGVIADSSAGNTGGNTVFIKSGTYTSGGSCYPPGATVVTRWIGYDTTRTVSNTDANRPLFQASGLTLNYVLYHYVRNLVVDSVTKAGGSGLLGNSGVVTERCKVKNANYLNFQNNLCKAIACEVDTCLSGFDSPFTTQVWYQDCEAHDCTNTGFNLNNAYLSRCISYRNATGFEHTSTVYASDYSQCVAYGNSGDGFKSPNTTLASSSYENCVAWGNGGYGFNFQTSAPVAVLRGVAVGSNSSANFSATTMASTGQVALSADPFTSGSGGDFSLNTTSGGGAVLRAAGLPATFPAGTTASYLDIGAAQHQDTGGSGSVIVVED